MDKDEQPTQVTRPPRPGTPGIEQRFVQRWRDSGHTLPGPFIVGFSGGPDSLALAVVLSRLQSVIERDIVLVHVDHRLRPESAEEAERARALAAGLQLPFVLHTLPDDPRKRHPSVGTEEAARRERYLALSDVATQHDASTLVIAHHRDDQAETVLLHLLRGAGLAGASGLREISTMTVPWWANDAATPTVLTTWRPLIDEPREALTTYLQSTGPDLRPIIDQSNASDEYRRNAIRNTILPQLESIVPGAGAALARFAAVASEEDELLNALSQEQATKVVRQDGTLNVTALRKLHPAQRRRVTRMWLLDAGAPPELSLDRVEAVVQGCMARRGGWRIEVGGGVVVGRHGPHVFVVSSDERESD